MTVLSLALVALTVQTADTIAPAVAVESPYTIKSGALELGATLAVPRTARKGASPSPSSSPAQVRRIVTATR